MDKPSIHYKWTIFHGYVNQRVISIDYQLAPIRQGSLYILRLRELCELCGGAVKRGSSHRNDGQERCSSGRCGFSQAARLSR
jgi:ribosomal protein S27AE